MRSAIMILALGACANVGPFRAASDEGGTGDGGVTTDGRTNDGTMLVDADQTVMATKLANVSGAPNDLAVTNSYVYWTQLGDYKIGRVAKSGGSVQTMSPGGIPLAFEARDGDVYWVMNREIHKTSDGDFTASAPLHANSGLQSDIAISTTDIYFFHDTAGVGNDELRRVSRSGGSSDLLRSGLSYPRDVDIDDQALYVVQDSTIEKAALATPASTTPVETVIGAAIASGGGRVCWAFQPDTNVYAIELWCTTTPGTKKKIATAPMELFAFVMSSDHVYWIPRYDDGTTDVLGYSFTTGQTSLIATPAPGTLAIALAIDGTALYWLTSDDTNGEIWKRPL